MRPLDRRGGDGAKVVRVDAHVPYAAEIGLADLCGELLDATGAVEARTGVEYRESLGRYCLQTRRRLVEMWQGV